MNTQKQADMLGHGVKDQRSGTSRSSKVNDRHRRTLKRAERGCWRDDLKNGAYDALFVR